MNKILIISIFVLASFGLLFSFIIPPVYSEILPDSLNGSFHDYDIKLLFSNGRISGSIVSDEHIVKIDNARVIERHDRFFIIDDGIRIFGKQLSDEKYLIIAKINNDDIQTKLRFITGFDDTSSAKQVLGQRNLFDALKEKQTLEEQSKSDNVSFREKMNLQKQQDTVHTSYDSNEKNIVSTDGGKTPSEILAEYRAAQKITGPELVIAEESEEKEVKVEQYIPELIITTEYDFRTYWKETFDIDIRTYDSNINDKPETFPFEGKLDDVDVTVILSLDDEKVTTLSGTTEYGQWKGSHYFVENLSAPGEYVIDVIASYLGKTVTETSSMFVIGSIADTGGSSNSPPVANAGSDQLLVVHLVTVNLNGSASSDPDGTISSYSWTQIVGSTVTINNANTATPNFNTVGAGDTYTFQLTVTDNSGATSTDTVTITT